MQCENRSPSRSKTGIYLCSTKSANHQISFENAGGRTEQVAGESHNRCEGPGCGNAVAAVKSRWLRNPGREQGKLLLIVIGDTPRLLERLLTAVVIALTRSPNGSLWPEGYFHNFSCVRAARAPVRLASGAKGFSSGWANDLIFLLFNGLLIKLRLL